MLGSVFNILGYKILPLNFQSMSLFCLYFSLKGRAISANKKKKKTKKKISEKGTKPQGHGKG